MSHPAHYTIPVITSGLCGGMSNIITSPLPLAAITFQNLSDVALYAIISALIGYGINKGIDAVTDKFKRPKSKRPKK